MSKSKMFRYQATTFDYDLISEGTIEAEDYESVCDMVNNMLVRRRFRRPLMYLVADPSDPIWKRNLADTKKFWTDFKKKEEEKKIIDTAKTTRFELIDDAGRVYSAWDLKSVKVSVQDDGRTLKVFINK